MFHPTADSKLEHQVRAATSTTVNNSQEMKRERNPADSIKITQFCELLI